MDFDLIKANLNLYAVLKNLEDLVKYDPEINAMAKDWKVSIQFIVKNGPKAYISFKDGACSVGRGKMKSPSIKLLLNSPAHLNKMMDGESTPIPLKGFTKIGFLTKDFDAVTKKLEYYLKPTDELLADKEYLAINTRLTMNTAAFALRELVTLDPKGKALAHHLRDGVIIMKVLPHGPVVNMTVKNHEIEPAIGDAEDPMACILMKNIKIANDFLNGKIDPFTAVVKQDVIIKGQVGDIDTLSIILDQIPHYLS
ncbi:MAG: hypothetical protein GY754_45620 [bacterium]|nr:hypothetical protein [bacterium]